MGRVSAHAITSTYGVQTRTPHIGGPLSSNRPSKIAPRQFAGGCPHRKRYVGFGDAQNCKILYSSCLCRFGKHITKRPLLSPCVSGRIATFRRASVPTGTVPLVERVQREKAARRQRIDTGCLRNGYVVARRQRPAGTSMHASSSCSQFQ